MVGMTLLLRIEFGGSALRKWAGRLGSIACGTSVISKLPT